MKLHRLTTPLALITLFLSAAGLRAIAGQQITTPPPTDETVPAKILIRNFLPETPLGRANRKLVIKADLVNFQTKKLAVRTELLLPERIQRISGPKNGFVMIGAQSAKMVRWVILAKAPGHYEITLRINLHHQTVTIAKMSQLFLPPLKMKRLHYIPVPKPVKTSLMIGALNCPLWETNHLNLWENVVQHPERMPALGYYDQANPQVSDWETKWAVEHGISYMVYCWYRASTGGPVTTHFSSAITALIKSRYGSMLKFAIMWENSGGAGVTNEADLMNNLLPFWIKNYFDRPNYLKIDNKPLLFIYRAENLVPELGSIAKVRAAFDRMRQACRNAGFAGLTILAEDRELDPNYMSYLKTLGVNYVFPYCWYIPNNPTPPQAVAAQVQDIHEQAGLHILPTIVTVSEGWTGWHDEGTMWRLPPREYKTLLEKAKSFVATQSSDELGGKMLLLDNWNEWSEGHFIAPNRMYGFGYLDAVRDVFTDAPAATPEIDLLPQDIGMGPYDKSYKIYHRRQWKLWLMMKRLVRQPGWNEKGLVGWWTFDESEGSPVAYDDSGHRLGGELIGAKRAKGIRGEALVCNGGAVMVRSNPLLSISKQLTIECWVKTDLSNQNDKWFVNRIYDGGNTGYRMGMLDGKPTFEIPVTHWDGYLEADEPLPMNKWTFLAGTFDGQTMRIYVNGKEEGSLYRTGPIRPNNFPLCLGSYDENHPAHFTGLLDNVKIYDYALSPTEIEQQYQKFRK